jgi:DNA invertase Pin-like site-specific DNA recombinase
VPKTIVSGTLVDGGRGSRDTPGSRVPKLCAECDSCRNARANVFGMSAIVGYARVSTKEQSPDAQTAELRAAGAERVFVDRGESSRVRDRPEWLECLEYMRAGDTLVVRRLDRLAGSERMAIETINDLHDRGINIKSLTEPAIDTTTPMGRALFGVAAVFAQLRVDTIRDNTRRGLAHAREQGRVGGRRTVMTPERVTAALAMREHHSLDHIAGVLGVGKSSVKRALDRADASDAMHLS